MQASRRMIINTFFLSITSLLMRTGAMIFQVYLSKKIGAAGIGLFQLIMSVSVFATTFAVSGIRFAATRVISEQLGQGKSGGVKPAVLRCCAYGLFFGTAASVMLFFGAHRIGTKWIGDIQTVLPLRLLALSLPCLALSAVFGGYFTAVCRIIRSSVVSVLEQVIRIAVTVVLLGLIPVSNIELSCSAIVLGGVIGEISSFIMLFALYLYDSARYKQYPRSNTGITRRVLNLALPLALSAYTRTALSTVQHLLIPRGLKMSGSTRQQALADYGTIGGMVLPIVTFPSAIFYSLAELIVPELTDAQVKNDRRKISLTVNRTLKLCLLLSCGIAGALFYYCHDLGNIIYSSPQAGEYIRVLSLLAPIMYLDSITDGMLRGLGQQMYCMYVNIADAVISVAMVFFLVPRFAINGYIFMICFTEIFNFILSLLRLSKLTQLHLSAVFVIKTILCSLGGVNIAAILLRASLSANASPTISMVLGIILNFIVYYVLLRMTHCTEKRCIKHLYKIRKT